MRKIFIIALYIIMFWILFPSFLLYMAWWLDHRYTFIQPVSLFSTLAGMLIITFSLLLLVISIIQYIKQGKELPISATPAHHLIQNGLYAVWRHPIYLFYTLLFIGIALVLPSFSMLVVVIPSFIMLELVYIYLEERYLIKRFGDQYRFYRQKTPLLFPTFPNFLRLPVHFLFRIFFMYRIYGKENIPQQSPFFILAAHKNYLDSFYIATTISYPIRFITTFEVFRNSISRYFFRKLNCIPKKRYCTDLRALREIIHSIEHNWVIGIFPEGERSWTGQTASFKPEVLNLLKKYNQIPIVPVQLSGNYLAWPRWAKYPRRVRISIHFQKPFYVAEHQQLSDLEEHLKTQLHGNSQPQHNQSKPQVHNISLVLYRCPVCRTFESFNPRGSTSFKCWYCQTWYTLLPDYTIRFYQNGSSQVQTIDELYQQLKVCSADIVLSANGSIVPTILHSGPAILYIEQNDRFVKSSRGELFLMKDQLRFQHQDQSIQLELKNIASITIESNYKLQIYNRRSAQLCQVTFEQESALKWQDYILETMQKELGWIPNYR